MQKKGNKIKIILLCGGKGERLHPLTTESPKPLIKIKGKPIISYIIDHLSQFDLYDLIITTGYKANKISEYFRSIESNYKIINSGEVDIIKRIQDSTKFINGDFMVLYGDTISNININNLIDYHKSNDRPVTMTVWPMQSQFGIVEITEDGNVIGFKEKPKLDKWINIGYFYFKNEMIETINQHENYAEFLKEIASQNLLNAFRHNGIHITVNTIRELADAEKNINFI
tara:strand:+ start:2742 stop:3425 length:684 start_codon:yes stop_codon:yes gene_type:complete